MKRLQPFLFVGIVLVLIAAPVLPSLLHAQVMPPDVAATSSVGGLKGFACKIAGWIFTIAIILSIILALWTAIQYMMAGGDPEKFKLAHKKLLYIVVGIAVALLARTMPIIVGGVLQARGGGSLDVCSGQYR